MLRLIVYSTFSYLSIADTPRVTAHKTVNTQENDNAELHCNYRSSSSADVTWIRNNHQLRQEDNEEKYQVFFDSKGVDGQNRSTLLVKNVQNADLGIYVCEVRNSIGNGNANITLSYEPEVPVLEDTHIHGDIVTTQWKIRSWQALSEVMLKYQQKGVSSYGLTLN